LFNLDGNTIKQTCSVSIFNKGLKYLKEERIASVRFNHNTMTVFAQVNGTEMYHTIIRFNSYGNIDSYKCDCPAFATYSGPCKHVIALLLYIYYQDSRGVFDDAVNKKFSEEIFNIFEKHERSSTLKAPLLLEPTLEISTNHYRTYEYQLSLKIGSKKLYIVKNIRSLLNDLREEKTIYFGIQFTLDPALHSFNEDDQKLINLLMDIHDTVLLLSPYSTDYYTSRLFSGKYATVSQGFVANFLTFYRNPFNLIVDGKAYTPTITEDKWALPLSLNKKADDLVLKMGMPKSFIKLDTDFNFILCDNLIYNLTTPTNNGVKPFLSAYENHGSNEFYFSGKSNEKFISKILPHAEHTGSLTIDDSLSETLVKLPLSTEIYLDKQSNLYHAEVKFNYGDNIINPYQTSFSEKSQSVLGWSSKADEANSKIDQITTQQKAHKQNTTKVLSNQEKRYVIRDTENEKTILNILNTSGLSQLNGKLCTKNDDILYKFITETIPELQKHATLYYSEAFKKISIRSSISFSGGIRLNQETNLLEFDFNTAEVSSDELKDLLASIKIKKKYFKLKNGGFINLESDDVVAASQLLDSLDLSGKDFEKGIALLPKHRAMYLETTLKQFKEIKLQRNKSFEKLVNDILSPDEMEHTTPDELNHTLRPYQVFGFKWLNTLSYYGFGGILADDMGLGKTLQMLTFLLSYKKAHGNVNALIVVPTSLVFNWQAEIEKFTPTLTNTIVAGNKSEREELLTSWNSINIIITSYPLIRRDIDIYEKMSFDFCILDEAQHIKNPGSQNAKCVKSIISKHRFALTGTPMENNLSELWSIFDFIMPGYLFSHNKFSQRFEIPIVKQQSQDASNNLSRHISPFILRRLKRDVLKELPEKIENKMISELIPEQKKIYLAYLSKAKGEISSEINDKGYEKSQIKILAALTRLRQICCHPALFIDNYKHDSGKLLQLEEIVQDAIEGNHRILLFSQFSSMLGIIAKKLDSMHFEYFYLDGSTPILDRGEMVNRFNNGERQLFLISLKAGGTGLNLTGADTVIHYDPWWNPAVEEQATDRAYRIGQEKRVQVIKLITKGTIEEKIYELQQKKKALIDNVIQPGETLISKLSKEEITALFE